MAIVKAVCRLLFFLLIAAMTLTACDFFGNFSREEFVVPPTTSPLDLLPPGPTPTRRPIPTPLPTEELARPLSESPDPIATAVVLSEEEQAVLGIESVMAAQRAGLSVNALRATITDENLSSGESGATLLEFVRPNSYRMVTEELELIVAAGQTFLKDITANWLVSAGEQTERFGTLLAPFTDEQFVAAQLELFSRTVEGIRLVGEEDLNGIQTQIFTFSAQTAGVETPVQTTVWIGIEDTLLHKQVITYAENGENYRLTTAFEYGDSVRIEPPLP
jgi:hypothetical protein